MNILEDKPYRLIAILKFYTVFGRWGYPLLVYLNISRLYRSYTVLYIFKIYFITQQTPGRLVKDVGDGDNSMDEEYVVFDTSQVLPLCLISMTEPGH